MFDRLGEVGPDLREAPAEEIISDLPQPRGLPHRPGPRRGAGLILVVPQSRGLQAAPA